MEKITHRCRVATAYPEVSIADTSKNKVNLSVIIGRLEEQVDVIVLPELCITGYSVGDLFHQETLLKKAFELTLELANSIKPEIVAIVGVPIAHRDAIYNCAAVLNNNKIIGLVPKSYLPNYKEFYEKRWFAPAPIVQGDFYKEIPFGTDLLFYSEKYPNLKIGVSICEDEWAVIPPSSFQALAGATLLVNLSASNETVGKSEYRRNLIATQSGRCMAAYAYCSAGPTESTSDLVFGGHCIIAENGSILAETKRFEDSAALIVDIDLDRLVSDRQRNPTFNDSKRFVGSFDFRQIEIEKLSSHLGIKPENSLPFVPNDPEKLKERCWEIFNIQTCALAKRIQMAKTKKIVIGVSGGLDSTLALLIAKKTVNKLKMDPSCIVGITMPGFGTTDKTKGYADQLMSLLGVTKKTIDIRNLAFQVFDEIDHVPFGNESLLPERFAGDSDDFSEALKELPSKADDLVFENVQARLRTLLLMCQGFTLGTGDLSELALGWCTYNADHMSMYNPNCSIPKTLVKFLVEWIAKNEAETLLTPTWQDHVSGVDFLRTNLHNIANNEISPELLPVDAQGNTNQSSEESLGPFILMDFFLYHFIRNNYSADKIVYLALKTFEHEYHSSRIKNWWNDFIKRFFQAQYKRNCVPDGPKVGSVSLSPRGDWRMPSDGVYLPWLVHNKW